MVKYLDCCYSAIGIEGGETEVGRELTLRLIPLRDGASEFGFLAEGILQ